MNSVAIIFDTFGPYHVARLQAAAQVCDLLAIEVAGASEVYAWDRSVRGNFQQVRLVEESTANGVSRAELRRRMDRALDEFRPDVVVIPGWASPAAWGAMRWCLRHRVPMVCMSESTAWDEPRVGWKMWMKKKLVGLFSAALVGGERHRDYLAELGMPSRRVFLGYDAVDNDYFREKAEAFRADADKTRRDYALPQNYFLASARFVEKKNLPRLLEAYAQYRTAGDKPWSLVLLGDGILRPELEVSRAGLGLRNDVVMPGFKQIADLPAYYALAGAFIHPSTVEPWGLVVNEAAACGLPLLVSDRCGCAPELVHVGVNGFTFDPLSVEKIAQAMLRVAAPDFPRVAFGQKSREIVADFGPKRFAEGLGQAVSAALASSPVVPTSDKRALLWALGQR